MPLKSIFIFFFFALLASSGFAQQPKLMLPIGHSSRVITTRFSPDGKLALTVSTDGTAKLWETATGIMLKDFKSGGDASIVLVTDARFSSGGKKIVINYEGFNNRIYDIASGQMTPQIIDLDNR